MGSNYDILSRILGKLAGKSFYGNFKIVIQNGEIVHIAKEQTFKPDDLKRRLDAAQEIP